MACRTILCFSVAAPRCRSASCLHRMNMSTLPQSCLPLLLPDVTIQLAAFFFPLRSSYSVSHDTASSCYSILEPTNRWLMMKMIYHAQQVQTFCVVWKPRVEHVQSCVQQNSPFPCLVVYSEAGCDIISCASLSRTLRATFEDMVLMIRVLHRSV